MTWEELELYMSMIPKARNIRCDFDDYLSIAGGQVEGAFEMLGISRWNNENLTKAAIAMLALLRLDALNEFARNRREFQKVASEITWNAQGRRFDFALAKEEFTKILDYAVAQDLTENPDLACLLAAYLSVIMLRGHGPNHEATKKLLLKTLGTKDIQHPDVQVLAPVFLILWNVDNCRDQLLAHKSGRGQSVRRRKYRRG